MLLMKAKRCSVGCHVEIDGRQICGAADITILRPDSAIKRDLITDCPFYI